MELWKEGGNVKGREGEDRSPTSTRELTLSRGSNGRMSNGHYPLDDSVTPVTVVVVVRLAQYM